MQTNLYTDDSFKFNQVLKEMTLTVQDAGMLTYKRDHDKFLDQFRSGSSKYVFADETEFKHFIAGMKRWVFLDTLNLVFANFKGKEWARSSL